MSNDPRHTDAPGSVPGLGAVLPVCRRAPDGWKCTGLAEHDGPCAAIPVEQPITAQPDAVTYPYDPGLLWTVQVNDAIFYLGVLIDRRRRAVQELVKMAGTPPEAAGLPDPDDLGREIPPVDDTTHYLADTDAFLALANRLCTSAGIAAITDMMRQEMMLLRNIPIADQSMRTGGPNTQAEAEIFMANVTWYVDQQKLQDRQMRAAGYSEG